MDQPEGFFDAGPFIGALFITDPRHAEAFPLVEAARLGQFLACTTTGVLSEVYAALTWQQAQPPHTPQQASLIVAALIKPPSAILPGASTMRVMPQLQLRRAFPQFTPMT